MSEIRFRSDIGVRVNTDACCGSDETLARAAWAVPPHDHNSWDWQKDLREQHGKDGSDEGIARVLRACMKLKHNTVFEHGSLSFYVEAPGVVWWQLTRQRFMSLDSEDFSFAIESGRYKHLEPEFYVPPEERPIREIDGFNPMRPKLQEGSPLDWDDLRGNLRRVCESSWEAYKGMTGVGISREIARLCLPNWALYCDGYVTGKPLTWLQFFSKRNRTPDTATPTFPMHEIEQFAAQCESHFAEQYPITHAAFIQAGRMAP